MQSLVLVSSGGSIALQRAVLAFIPVLSTPQNKREASPTTRFFHAQNLWFWTWGGSTRKDGRTTCFVLIYPTSILLIYQVSEWFFKFDKERKP